ncbi:Ankyrin repeat-containing domain protein [Tylopilus felleus]
MICSLVENGADVCRLSPDGNTLLHAAIFTFPERHALAVARLLIGAGCNPAVYNRHRRTALHIAVQKGYVSVLKYILTLDQLLPDDILFTVLKSRHRSQVPILRALISKGANTRGVVDGKNLLHVVIPLLPYDWLKVLNIRVIVKTIVDSGCDTLAPNSRGETPLHLAVAAGYISLVMYLMSITTPPSLPTDILACALGEGPVPTRYSWKNTYQILRLLIDKGANTHVRAADGGTLLHMAIKNDPRLRKLPTTPRILPIPLPPSRPLSPLPLKLSSLEWNDSMDSDASEGENLLLLELEGLEEHDLLDIIRLLVDSGCNPTRCDADGNPPIHFAEVRGHFDVLEYLLPLTVDKPWQNLQDTTDSTPRSVCGEVKEELATSTC